jgi:hypothetical protein
LLSNQSSSLYASSTSSGGADQSSYIYDMKQSGINKFTEKFVRTPVNSPAFGGNAQVEIPAFGILKQMVLKTTIKYNLSTAVQTPQVAKALFAELIDQISLKNSSRELQVVHGDCIKYLVYNLGASESKKWRILGKDDLLLADPAGITNNVSNAFHPVNLYGDVKTAVGEHTIDVYTIVPFSMFPKFGSDPATPFKNLLNTRFCERLSLDIKFNPRTKVLVAQSAVGAGAGKFAVEPTIEKCELITQFDIIQDKSLAAIEAANYSLSQPLALVLGNWNKSRSTFTASAGVNNVEVQLFNTDLTHSILITCKKVNTIAQLQNLTKAINIKSCDHDQANAPNDVFAQVAEGYGDAVVANKQTALAADGRKVAQPLPFTNKHAIKHDEGRDFTGVHNFSAGTAAQKLAAGQGVSRLGADHQEISSIKLTSAGRELYRADSHLEALYLGNSEMRGSCWFDDANRPIREDADLQDVNGNSQYNMYLIKFGDDDNLDAIRGMLSLKNLNSIKLEMTIPRCVEGGTYEVNVYVRKYSAISIEASSGRISTAVST